MTNKEIGKYGESLAKEFLIKKGYKILEMNFKYSRLAEIDIIASFKNAIHFVEVKTRTSADFGAPLEAITEKKLASIFQCAKFYLIKNNIKFDKVQIDALGIILNGENEPEYRFVEDISL